MLTLLSPAKTLDFDTPSNTNKNSQPTLLDDSERLINELVTKSPHDLQQLMGISESLAELNVQRFHDWRRPFSNKNAKAAALAFQGDVYVGLAADTFSDDDFAFAQQHLRILSGLYGVLKPLDLMQAYRLEMGTKLSNERGKNLYEFWGDKITQALNKDIKTVKARALVNLASNEYFKSVKKKQIAVPIVTPAFRDWRNGQYKMISFFAKKARGLMAAWLIKERVTDPAQIIKFSVDGYEFNAELSSEGAPVFTRRG